MLLKKIIRRTVFAVGITASFLVSCFGKKAEPEVYLIPKRYVGPMVVIFNKENGHPPKYENGARVYDIPETGILLTQFQTNDGRVPRDGLQFFHVNQDGAREKIQWSPLTNSPETEGQIYFVGTGVSGQNQYKEFIVGKKSDRDSLYKVLQNLDLSKY